MIVSGQKNLKVHFAGFENGDFSKIALDCAGISYTLFTAFPFVSKMLDIKCFSVKSADYKSIRYQDKRAKHTIMDSAFTLALLWIT